MLQQQPARERRRCLRRDDGSDRDRPNLPEFRDSFGNVEMNAPKVRSTVPATSWPGDAISVAGVVIPRVFVGVPSPAARFRTADVGRRVRRTDPRSCGTRIGPGKHPVPQLISGPDLLYGLRGTVTFQRTDATYRQDD
jgi:hypothetical protein